jgi:hypothetical protein
MHGFNETARNRKSKPGVDTEPGPFFALIENVLQIGRGNTAAFVENLQTKLANTLLFAARRFEQSFRRGPMFRNRASAPPSLIESQAAASPALSSGQPVEREIELQHVHARLA